MGVSGSHGAVRSDLDEVFRRDYQRVVGVAARVLGSRDQAEDVAQEVFLSFGRSAVPAGDARGWLSVAAAHTALNLLRSGRRRVLLALSVLTVVLIALSGWGFSRVAAESGASTLTSGEARLTASILLNLVMFGFSLIAALGTAFLAGPTLAGETESGIALALLARPIRRSAFLLGKWLGLVAFGSGFVVLAGLAQCLVVRATVDYWPPRPAAALGLLAAQTVVLLTLAVLLSTVISPMASGVVAVGLFCTTWVAGVVGGIGGSLGNESVARIGSVSRMLLPTDGLWRGAMNAFQDPAALALFGSDEGAAFPFLSAAPLTLGYLGWAVVWVAMVWGLAAASFVRKDL